MGIGDFERSRAEAEALVELTRGVQDRPAEAGALVQLANAFQWKEDFPAARERAREAIEIAETSGAQAPLGGALHVRGYVHLVSGRLDAGEEDLGRALAIGRKGGETNRQALVLHALALRRCWQGEYRASLELADEAVQISREHRLAIPLLRSLWNIGVAQTDLGDYDRALAALGEGLALAEKVGDDAIIPRIRNTLGWLLIDCGDFARGIELCIGAVVRGNESLLIWRHGTGAERRAFIRINEADAWMAQGDFASAARALEEALHTVQHPPPSRWMTWRYSAHCYASLGQLALLSGDPERARRLADQSLELVPTASRKYESWAWRIKGESATARPRLG